jgi:hypothetical protein
VEISLRKAIGKGAGIATVSPPVLGAWAMPQPPLAISEKKSRGPSVTNELLDLINEVEIFGRPSLVIWAESVTLGGSGDLKTK